MSRALLLSVLFGLCAVPGLFAANEDPLTLTATGDTYLTPDMTGRPGDRGSRDEFQIFGKPDKLQFRALLKFDLSQVAAPPAKAVLHIYAFNIGRPKKLELIRCHAVAREWDEKLASWDMCLKDDRWVNPGGDWDPNPAGGCNVTTLMGGDKIQPFDFDVTELVQMWVLKRRPNYGFILMLDPNTTAELRCRSREGGANQPELKLGWNAKVECGPAVLAKGIKPYGEPVKSEPVWTTASLPLEFVGKEFSDELVVRGGMRPYKFTADKLPDGLKLTEDGVLSGSVKKEGKYRLQFACAGADGKKSMKVLELEVQVPSDKEKPRDDLVDKLSTKPGEKPGDKPGEKPEQKADQPKTKAAGGTQDE